MLGRLLIIIGLLVSPAFAADNAVVVTPGTGVTMKSKDVGTGVQAMQPILSDATGNTLATPSAGADTVSNSTEGLATYNFPLVFNGTTWDRWYGDKTNGAWVNVKTSVLPTGAATSALQSTINTSIGTGNTSLASIDSKASLPIPDCGVTPCTNKIGNVYLQSQYPVASTAITGNATGTTGAVVGTLAGTTSKTTYICGFDVSAIGGTAAIGPITVAGLVGSSMVFQLASSASGVTLSRTFTPCVPASATNTSITITTTADGTATAVDVNSWGYQQ